VLLSHELKLTKSRLLKLYEHELVLRIWDAKEHCSARARFDKPKQMKFSNPIESAEETRATVIEASDKYLKQLPKEWRNKSERKLPNQFQSESKILALLTKILPLQ
jgi:hypothetical protein